ncbi:alpha/beta fold hydrolase [Nannocystis sp. ILAH1]|uniref:alpha/beta fold hydrolase n=1 Tax=unclassified Nannocystis TaxID=2627009 RepID=UPI00226DC649|nr:MULTISPECIES: alpha/beta fold hydrolase [unclassified Nannocystis]MCY0992320.1 alpha/beta fold hydrolase [Nannocystis sp. ILAH1]MCY1069092.1 alpha/beta fold hydrolase [Nannocystis sp. RBIL2]
MGDGGPFSRVKGAARKLADMAEGTATIGAAWQRALRDRAISPTRYLAPLVKRATGLGDPPVNSTPKRVVYARGGMKLIRFEPAVRRFRTPILFVYSLINRYYILDFLPGRSLIEFMTQQGFDVYAIDWGTPGAVEQDMTWDDLLGGFVEAAKRWVFKLSGADDLTMYGYCMGGTMALAAAALHPNGVRNFVAQATPVDFKHGGIFTTWTDPEFFDVDSMVDAYGNVPIDLMESGFSMMAPVQRISKWFEVFRRLDDRDFVTNFLAMEHWAADNVPFPGEVYRQYVRDCYQENNFFEGRMIVGGRRVDLRQIHGPLLVLVADNDTIAPPPSSEALLGAVSSTDKTLLRFPVGHIGLSTSSKGPRVIWPKIAGWLAEHSEPLPPG